MARKVPPLDDGRWVHQPLASVTERVSTSSKHCECCEMKKYKKKRQRQMGPSRVNLLVHVSSVFFLYSSACASSVVQAASSHQCKASYPRGGGDTARSQSYHSPLYFSEDEQEERILSALAAEYDESYELDYYSNESQAEDADVAVNDHTQLPSVPTVVREQTQYFQSPARSESRHQHDTLMPQKTPQEIGEETLRQKALQYVSLPENYRVNTTTSTKIAEPTVPDLTTPWVRQFLASCPRDVLLPVPREYVLDNFNLAQLAPVVEKAALQNSVETLDPHGRSHPIYRQALRLILQEEPCDPATVPDTVQRAAKVLYLLVHQRYVLSPRGLDTVRRRFLLKQTSVEPIFGRCPRVACRGMPLLPFGDFDNFQVHGGTRDARAKRYCASCGEGFYHWDSKVDGCAWGTSFCHLFLLTCGDEVFSEWRHTLRPSETVVPRIFGFELHPSIQKRQSLWQDHR
jgi:casein kinase II subunit beta